MSFLLDNISIVVGIFYEYATHKEGCAGLTRREMKTLIEKEFADVIKEPHDPKTVALTFQLLDINGDGLVDFDEYLLLIFRVAKACLSPQGPRGHVRQKGDTSRGLQLQGDERTHRQQRNYEREEKEVCEKRDSEWKHLRTYGVTTRLEQGRDGLPARPVDQGDLRRHQAGDCELWDSRRRYHQLYEPQERDDEYKGQSRESRGRKAEDHHGHPHEYEPEGDCDESRAPSRDGDGRSRSRDPECEQRISQFRGRSPSQDADRRQDGWATQPLSQSQSREGEHRSEPLHERERSPSQSRDRELRTGPNRRELVMTAKVEDQQRSCGIELGEQDRSRCRPSERECYEGHMWRRQTQVPREGDWRRQQYYEAESVGRGQTRRLHQREHRVVEWEESQSRDCRARPTKREQDGSFPSKSRPREQDRSREQTDGPETEWRSHRADGSEDGDGEQCRQKYFEPQWRDGGCRRTQKQEPDSREDAQPRRWYCEDDEDLCESDRGQRWTQQHNSDFRYSDQRRIQHSGPRGSWEDQRTPQHVPDSREESRTHQHDSRDRRPSQCDSSEQRRPRDSELEDSEWPRRTQKWGLDAAGVEQQEEMDIGNRREERRNRGYASDPTDDEQRRTQESEPDTTGRREQLCASDFGGGQCASETREDVQPGKHEPGSPVTDSICVSLPESGLQGGDMSRDRRCDIDPRKGDPQKPQSSEDRATGDGPQQRDAAESHQSEKEANQPCSLEPTEGGQGGAKLLAAQPEQVVRASPCEPELRGDQRREAESCREETQERERRREKTPCKKSPSQASNPQAAEGLESRAKPHQNDAEPRLQAPETHQLLEKDGTPEQSALPGPHQLPVLSASREGGGGHPTPTEESHRSSPRAQEPQPPLDTGSQSGSETPPHVGRSKSRPESGEPDGSQAKSGLSVNKATMVSNPLYEYLLAQKLEES